MADTLVALGRVDSTEDCEMRDVLARVEDVLRLCEGHAQRETEIVTRAIEARRPGATERFTVDHDLLADIIEQLRELAARRDPSLYSRFSAFVAEMLAHMAREEWEGEGVLREAFDAAERAQLQRQMDAALATSKGMPTLRWMIPAMTHAERAGLLESIRDIDVVAFGAALALARAHLGAREFARLDSELMALSDTNVER